MDEERRQAAPHDEATVSREMDRRDFFQWAAGLSIGATALLGLVTAASAVNPPPRSIDGKTKMGPTPLAAVADLKPGVPQLFEYGDDSVFITKKADGKILALNAACPHVACKLHWDANGQEFACPCHASFFTLDGVKKSGPATRNMDQAVFEVVGGKVVVSGFAESA